MMASSDVIEVLSLLNDAGLTAWVDGGWGVDALLGEATREHADLDLVALEPQLAAVRSLLSQAGYASVLRDLLPASVAVADGQGHEVDLHPVTHPRRWRRPGPGGWWELPLPATGARQHRWSAGRLRRRADLAPTRCLTTW